MQLLPEVSQSALAPILSSLVELLWPLVALLASSQLLDSFI